MFDSILQIFLVYQWPSWYNRLCRFCLFDICAASLSIGYTQKTNASAATSTTPTPVATKPASLAAVSALDSR